MVGSRLGSYDIQALAGRGGMGEVYRARDSKLKRTVALKILPSEFSQQSERLQRFQLEAEALAALNHPNIAAIHALEEDNQTKFLVLEFVEGDTLGERLTSGPIPIDEVMSIALQICRALAAAHDRGIVHRDLKPANIKITPARQVKLLDFGLAKAMDGAGSQDPAYVHLSQSPTIASPAMMTGAGVILGTAAYMAPEQARGKAVDKRADLWALGCVLYEMVTAKPVFAGETVTDVLAAVVTQTPDLEALPANTPAQLRWVIERCLQKDPSVRLRDAGDAELALAFPMRTPGAAIPARRTYWAAGVGAVAALIAAAVVAALSRSPAAPASLTRFDIPVPGAAGSQAIAVSPDGRQVVYVADAGQARIQLWMRSLDHVPIWSPDGTRVLFDSHRSGEGSELYEIPSSGATQEKLVLKLDGSKDFIAAADWSRDGTTVLFHRAATGGPPWAIWAWPFTGDKKPFVYKESAADHVGARMSPNGRFVAYSTNESGTYQVVVQPFPDPSTGKWQVSDAGGAIPVWRADGRELFYLTPSGDLTAVSVTTDPTFAIGSTTKLFRAPLTFVTQGAPYDVAADGQRFLIAAVSGDTTPSPISTILNWTALAARAP